MNGEQMGMKDHSDSREARIQRKKERREASIIRVPLGPRNRPEVIAAYRAMLYRDYLQTEWWKKVKRAALARAGYTCQGCKCRNKPLEVHHLTYERLGTEHDEDLLALCGACHIAWHALTLR